MDQLLAAPKMVKTVPRGYRLDDNGQPAKTPWTSKTLWTSVVIAIAAFFPQVRDWVSQNPGWVTEGLAIVFGALRVITKGRIEMTD